MEIKRNSLKNKIKHLFHSVELVSNMSSMTLEKRRMLEAELMHKSRMHLIDFEGKIDTFHRLDWINCFEFNF